MGKSDIKKRQIIANTIEQDQRLIVEQWIKTLQGGHEDNPAYAISTLMFSCIARGKFEIRSQLLKNKDWRSPPTALKVVDYLSHASRIIIDYKNLSPEHKVKFLSYFPSPSSNKSVFSRSATHAVTRENNVIQEHKGFWLGVAGQLSPLIKTENDFGVNIAMGGLNKLNFIDKKIQENGFSGHLYFHKRLEHDLIMVGLEQSAPTASVFDLIHQDQPNDQNFQSGTDQFEQGHSLVGASDTYTAAGSLYFSDPVYRAKLLANHNCVAPDKYDSMLVTLDDKNWKEVELFFDNLTKNKLNSQVMSSLLLEHPSSAKVLNSDEILSYIALDFDLFFKSVGLLFDDKHKNNNDDALKIHNDLLKCIHSIIAGDAKNYKAFIEITNFINNSNAPDNYKAAIQWIVKLFHKQIQIDPKLNNIHNELLLNKKSQDLLINVQRLEAKIALFSNFFSSELICPDRVINDFLYIIQQQNTRLKQITKHVSMENDSHSSHVVEEHHLSKSWSYLNQNVSITELKKFEIELNQIDNFLLSPPKLFSNLDKTLLAQSEKANQLNLESVVKRYDDERKSSQALLDKQRSEEQLKFTTALNAAKEFFSKQITDLQIKLADANTAMHRLSNDHNKEIIKRAEVEGKLDIAKKENISALIAEKELFSKKILELETKLADANTAINRLSNDHNKEKTKRAEVEGALNTTKRENTSELYAAKEFFSKQIADLETKLIDADAAISRLTNDFNNEKIKRSEVEGTLDIAKKENTSVRHDLGQAILELNQNVVALNNRIQSSEAAYTQKINALELQLANANKCINEAKKTKQSDDKKLNDLTRELRINNEKNVELEQTIIEENASHLSDLNALRTQISSLQENLNNAQKQERVLSEQLMSARVFNNGLKDTIAGMERSLANKQDVLNDNDSRIGEFKRNLSVEIDKNKRLCEALENVTRTLNKRDQELSELNKKLSALVKKNLDVENTIKTNQSAYAAEVERLKDQLTDLTTNYNTSLTEIVNLQNKLDASKAIVERLKSEKDTTQVKLDVTAPSFIHSQNSQADNQPTIDKKEIQKRLAIVAPVFAHLYSIQLQGEELSNGGYTNAADAAFRLKRGIESEVNTFINVDEKNLNKAFTSLKVNCLNYINEEKSILEAHRGWGYLIGNVIACILSLGVGYVVAGCVNLAINNQFTFFNRTSTADKVLDLQNNINELASAPVKT